MSLALPCVLLLLCAGARAQVNSGSTGADGAFNPTTNTVINMADHPDGIYHYTSVNIPAGVEVSFIPNANNTPVVWLVQQACVVNGTVKLDGTIGLGGPGGYRGGNAGNSTTAGNGLGPGGGPVGPWGGQASYGTSGYAGGAGSGPIYGNNFLVPLIGGSGGGGSSSVGYGGGGGGGAILIVASQTLTMNGQIYARGGYATAFFNNTTGRYEGGGAGSGGAVRLVATTLAGAGSIQVGGGIVQNAGVYAGSGRVRLDAFENNFGGVNVDGQVTRGFQPIIIPSAGQGTQLTVQSVSGVSVATSPNGVQAAPDVIIAGQQSNPVAIVVRCTNLPLNTPVTVTVKPANGAAISAVGYNTSGTLASSTATVQLNMPRGGGLIYATAATAP